MSDSNTNGAKMIEVPHKDLVKGRRYYFQANRWNVPDDRLNENKRIGTYEGEKQLGKNPNITTTMFSNIKRVHSQYKNFPPLPNAGIENTEYTPTTYKFYQVSGDVVNHFNSTKQQLNREAYEVHKIIKEYTDKSITHWGNTPPKLKLTEPYKYGETSKKSETNKEKSKTPKTRKTRKTSKTSKGGKRKKTKRYLR
jgi:hypothetical protein